MSLYLSIDTYLLCNMFNISKKKLDSEYSGMSIEDIMKAEAEKGNTAAAKFDSSVLSDPAKLIQLFELNDPNNKYMILNNMNQEDLDNLLPSLSQTDLIQGLQYFSKDKLLQMITYLPKDQLLNYTFDMFSPEHVMQMMPDAQLDNMLLSPDMDKKQELKFLQTVNPESLNKMIFATTGQQAPSAEDVGLDGKPKYDVQQMVGQISELPDDKFKEAMLSMPKESKKAFVYKLTLDNPKLFNAVSSFTYVNMMDQKKDKQQLLRSASVIKPEQLVKMVSQLPKDLTAIVLTQMDTSKFAGVLQSKFKDVLSQIKVS